jgi:hypothetical protein
MARLTKRDVADIQIRVGERTQSPQEVLTALAKDPEGVSKQLTADRVTVVVPKDVLDWLRTIFGAESVGDDGTIAAQAGLIEVLIVIAFLGTIAGFAVGYEKGFEDGEAAAGGTGGDTVKDDDGGEEDGGGGEEDDGGGDGEGDAGG